MIRHHLLIPFLLGALDQAAGIARPEPEPEPLGPPPPRPWKLMDPGTHRNVETYWQDPPPERSARCSWWLRRFEAGWRPNRRYRSFGYYGAAEMYGVWIWEWLHVLRPALERLEEGLPVTWDGQRIGTLHGDTIVMEGWRSGKTSELLGVLHEGHRRAFSVGYSLEARNEPRPPGSLQDLLDGMGKRNLPEPLILSSDDADRLPDEEAYLRAALEQKLEEEVEKTLRLARELEREQARATRVQLLQGVPLGNRKQRRAQGWRGRGR